MYSAVIVVIASAIYMLISFLEGPANYSTPVSQVHLALGFNRAVKKKHNILKDCGKDLKSQST